MKSSNTLVAQALIEGVGAVSPFPGSQFPYPINQSFFGELNLESLRRRAENSHGSRLEDELPLSLALAEVVEASQPDKKEFFISDRDLRARLLRLNSTDGWALLWGEESEKTTELAALLREEHLQVYTLLPDSDSDSPLRANKQFKFLGSRQTSSIYFFQALVRYAHLYGRIPLGDSHQVEEFIQDHSPGVIFLAKEKLSPVEEALFLGGLFLGIPAVVPASFPSPYGNLLHADDPQGMVKAALNLPNLRTRRRLRFQVNIPYSFDATFVSEEIKEGNSMGGTASSSFIVTNIDKGDGVEIEGELGADVGIEIAIGDPRVDTAMTDYLEEFASRLPSYIQGVSAQLKDGCPTIRWRIDVPLQVAQLGQAYYDGLKAHFKIDRLKVRLVFTSHLLEKMKAEAELFRQKRRLALATASEETEPFFYACTRCHSFALEHACTLTPERPPQCGTKSWTEVKTRALLSDFDSGGMGTRYAGSAIQAVVEKGRLISAEMGEYEGVNASTELLTEGHTNRVFLHSIFEHPHTACSCFQCVGFYIPAVDGIGLMNRAFSGAAPDGRSWDDIANAMAGKQVSGYVGFSPEYMRSKKFLKGSGGWERVVWMPRELKEKFAPDKPWIATEADVKNLEELAGFLRDRKTREKGSEARAGIV